MATTPPKRNFNSKRGMKKKRYPFNPSKEQAGLGSAYNSTTDPRGPDAYVPVPDSRRATQRPNRGRSNQAKRPIDGYRKGSEFLDYKLPSQHGDMPGMRKRDAQNAKWRKQPAPYGRNPDTGYPYPKPPRNAPKKKVRRRTGDGWIG